MRRTELPDGGGDLIFEESVSFGSRGNGHGPTMRTTRHGFLAVDAVREVEDRVRRVLLPGG